ncbi:hypothetical protein GW950_01635, partial [Candidatus Wolfebacteria bacterium]|nr:hypothetical protein [Candidatus Wolfebacteria bacterium]
MNINMRSIEKESNKYLKTLKSRSQQSRVYNSHQMTGLILAETLKDLRYKSLYIKLAKTHDNGQLIALAKDVAERKDIKNAGAYFMKAMKASNINKI